jgi:hypothetical protein
MAEPTAQEYARLHRAHLQEHQPEAYAALQKSGELTSYLSSVGRQAMERYNTIEGQMRTSPEVQNLPFHEKVARLRSHHETAHEQVMADIVNPEPSRAD